MTTAEKWIEFTLDMGCPNNCDYCPQSVLLNKYFKNNKNRKRSLNLNDFKILLSTIPKDVNINFAGFSEPFVNTESVEMLEYADKEGYSISIYSTLRGLDTEKAERLSKLNVVDFTVHLPDKSNLMKFNITDEYLTVLKKVYELFPDAKFMVIGDVHNAITDILPIEKINKSKIISRSDNLDKKLLEKKVEFLKPEFQEYKQNEKIFCNRRFFNKSSKKSAFYTENTVVLPDGTILFCCMDWQMQHILGNLFETPYSQIMQSKNYKEIEDSMMCKNSNDILCRHCEFAVLYDKNKFKNFIITGKYEHRKKKNELLPKIFSVTNENNHKVITLFNIKIKLQKCKYRKKIYKYFDKYIFNPEKWQFLFCDCYISRKKLWRGIKSKAPLLNGSIIDIGCGRKPYEELFINCTKYEGLDYETPDINFEFERHADYYYDGTTFPFDKNSYDNAVCFQCLEHIPEPNRFLDEINRVIKPGGYLLLTCPFSFAQHFHPYDYFRFSSFGLKKLLEDTNFEIVEIKPLETSAETFAGNFLYYITSHIKYYSLFRLLFCLFYNIFSPLIYKLFPKDYEYTTDYLVLAKKKQI